MVQHHLTVQQQQRLHGRGRCVPRGCAGKEQRQIENIQQRISLIPHHTQIHRTPWYVGLHSRTASLEIQLAGDHQNRIPNLLGIQPPHIRTPVLLILWIHALKLSQTWVLSRLPISR